MKQTHQAQVHSPKQAAMAGSIPAAWKHTEAKGKIKGKLKAPQPRGWQKREDELRYVMFWENP